MHRFCLIKIAFFLTSCVFWVCFGTLAVPFVSIFLLLQTRLKNVHFTLNLCLLTTSWCMDRYDLCFQDQRLSFFLTEKGCYNSFFGPLRKWKKIVILKKIPDSFRTGRLYTVSPSSFTFPRSEKCPSKLPKLFQVSHCTNPGSSAQMISHFIFFVQYSPTWTSCCIF